EYGHRVAGAIELRRAGETRRTGADDGDRLARALERWLGHDPALFEPLVDDRALDALDGDRRLVDAEDARPLARRRADAPRELGEVVGLVQPRERLAPLPAVDEVVPLGDEVVDGAARGAAGQQRPRV